ncbi:MAG: hypothetical protein SNG81_09160 [Rikenellaceae bacterium]
MNPKEPHTTDKVEEIEFPSTLNLVIPDDFGGIIFAVDFQLEDFSIGRFNNLRDIDLSSNDNFIIRDEDNIHCFIEL